MPSIETPLRLAQKIRSLATSSRDFERALSEGPVPIDPFGGREFPGQSTRLEVEAWPRSDPMREPTLVWIDHLLERRINLEALRAESREEHITLHPPAPPFEESLSLGTMKRRALAALTREDGLEEGRQALGALAGASPALSRARLARFERYVAIEWRLGSTLRLPWTLVGEAPAGLALEGLETELARRALALTDDLAGELLTPGIVGVVRAATGGGAGDGWPARLAPASVLELLGGRWLTDGVTLGPAGLPERVCPASFLRAIVHVGQEVFLAVAPATLPFPVARRPGSLYGRAFGRTLALWFCSGVAARRRLGLSAASAAKHERALLLLLVAEVRLSAARALLAAAGRRSVKELEGLWEELGVRLAGAAAFSPAAWGPPLGLLAAPLHAELDWLALLLAFERTRTLRETFDEDWMDSPRAREVLLAEIHALEADSLLAGPLLVGLEELQARLANLS